MSDLLDDHCLWLHPETCNFHTNERLLLRASKVHGSSDNLCEKEIFQITNLLHFKLISNFKITKKKLSSSM